jgi:hypothetical protein
MMSTAGIIKAATAAAFAAWAIWTELRLRQAESSNAQLRRKFNDKEIEDANAALSDDALRAKLDGLVKG